jgi:molecular chaperone DnaK (HSP70)/tRNA A-37 threonylcarbamoyl transferase component Bud32
LSTSIGIDLGSSKCCAYAVRNGELELIPSAAGSPTMPSCVAFTPRKTIVGRRALQQAAANAEHTAVGVQRLLGRKFFGVETTWIKEGLPRQLVPASNGDAWVHVGGVPRSPQEVLSYVLEHVRNRAQAHIGAEVHSATLAIPAFFDERQRRATLEAASLAGLQVDRLIHAPTAAAIAHAHQNPTARGRWAILDVGAGGFDAAVVQIDGGHVEVLSAVGDPLLGGDDFDRRIADHIVDAFFEAYRVDLTDDPSAMYRVYEAARAVKHELSHVSKSSPIHLPMIARTERDVLALDHPGLARAAFEEMIGEELDRIAEPCALALDDIGFGTDDMDDVLLLGGMAQMPAVQRTVAYLFRSPPTLPAAGPNIVAMGAALVAAADAGELSNLRLDELTPHSIGIKIKGGRFSPVVHRRSIVPCREQKIFTAAREGQHHMRFEVYQGESELVNENVYLGRFEAEHVDRTNKMVIAFELDKSGLLSVAIGNGRGGKRVTLQASCGLSEADLDELRRERTKRSRLVGERRLPISYPDVASAPPPSGEGERKQSLRPGPRRSVAPPRGDAATLSAEPGAKPPPLPRRSAPPPAAGTATLRPGTSEGEPGSSFPIEVADDSLVGTTVGGRYVIEDIIADGGMGRVYLARHDVLDKKFALKVLHAELAQNEDLAQRFVREAKAAARIDSPHVVDISDFGRLDDGTGYFVMEYLSGATLAQLIHERGALPAKLIIDVALQLTSGLAVAHEMGIVHRDLKPDNVTLIQRGGHPYFCKILDFGIAKAPTSDSNKHETLAGTLLGTPHYMAPEQIDGVEVDGRSDIYSLGAVMYEMATGKPPFDAETLVGVLVAHKTEAPLPVRSHEVAAQCPLELQAIIHRCLAKKPADRFASATALHDALKKL